MKKSFNIYLVTVNSEPAYTSLSEYRARQVYLEELEYTEPGFCPAKRTIDFKTIKVDNIDIK